MAEYLIMVIPFMSYYAFSGLRKGTRLLCRFCLLFALGGVAFSFSRGSYLALLVIVGVFCLANIRKWTIILLGGISVLALIPSSVIERFMSVGSMDSSISTRFDIWTLSFQEIARNRFSAAVRGSRISGMCSWPTASTRRIPTIWCCNC